ncbi:MAG: hypothetical protein U9O18_06840 [Chloroflexota bacterium]|nr:hypothetical protein [Chloroflexota bacterium]
MTDGPPVVDRVAQCLAHLLDADSEVVSEHVVRDVTQGVSLERMDDIADGVRVQLQRVRLSATAQSPWSIARLVTEALELRCVAVGDALAQAAAVLVGLVRLADELVPIARVGADDSSVAHDERDAGWVQAVLEQLERATEIALPTVRVAGEQEVECARLR